MRSSIVCFPLWSICTRDSVAVKIYLQGKELGVISTYLPGEENVPTGDLLGTVNCLKEGGTTGILGMDANAHHLVWGSSDCNTRGEELLDYFLDNNLEVMNVGESPTFVTKRCQQVLDITLMVKGQHKVKIVNWHVSPEFSGSDHKYIRFDVQEVEIDDICFRNPRNTNWEDFRKEVRLGLQRCPITASNPLEVEVLNDSLTEVLLASFEASCRVTSKRIKNSVPWWNKQLEDMRARTRKLFNRAKRNGDWAAYKKVLTDYNNLLRRRKRETWKNFCQDINDMNTGARLHKCLAKTATKSELGSLVDQEGSTMDIKQSLELLLKVHFPDCIINTRPGVDGIPWKLPEYSWKRANEVINTKTLRWAIKEFKPYKAPGCDGVLPAMLQNSLEEVMVPLIRLYRGSLACGYIPSKWREVRVTFIPKPGRASYNEAKAYRPICLSSFLLKTMERMLDRHIRGKYNIAGRLRNQHAYLSGKSCETALFSVVGELEKSIADKEVALAAFLDIEGAFDNTPIEIMERALSGFGIDRCIITWIGNMLNNRKVQVSKGDCTVRALAIKGCPQGGVLSPLLWSLVVNSLLERINGLGFRAIGYADDIVIIIKGKVQTVLSELMNRALTETGKWCRNNGLTINANKAVIVPFTHKRKLLGITAPKLMGVEVRLEKSVKYLGVILDNKLNWRKHLEFASNKAIRALWTCRRLCGNVWGTKPKIMQQLYTVMVRPILTYGCVVWWHRTAVVVNRNMLTKVQRLACMIIGGGMRSTPTITMEVLFGLLPMEIYIEMEAMKAAYRIVKLQLIRETRHRCGFLKILDTIRAMPELDMPTDMMIPKFEFTEKFRVNKHGLCQGKGDIFNPPNGINVYTDGSKTKTGTGSGVWCRGPFRMNVSISLGPTPTVFQTEIYGILAAAHNLHRLEVKGQSINFLTDSQAACGALAAAEIKSKVVEECRGKLAELALDNKVSIYWIPGHHGIPGNEKADQAAKRGAERVPIGPMPCLGMARAVHRSSINRTAHWKLGRTWRRQSISHTKAFLKFEDIGKARTFLGMSRKDLRDTVAIVSGHCKLNKHMFNMKLSTTPLCRWCEEKQETPKHIVFECIRLEGKRMEYFGQLDSRDIKKSSSCKDYLRFLRKLRLM